MQTMFYRFVAQHTSSTELMIYECGAGRKFAVKDGLFQGGTITGDTIFRNLL